MMIEIQDEADRMDMDSMPKVTDWVSTKILKIDSFF